MPGRTTRARFEKLEAAYVKARYSRHYRVTTDELAWLGEHVEELGRAIHAVTAERLAGLRRSAVREQPGVGQDDLSRISGPTGKGSRRKGAYRHLRALLARIQSRPSAAWPCARFIGAERVGRWR